MPHAHSLASSPRPALALGAGWSPRVPDFASVETGMARAFAAVRSCARIAWWDGSAFGLRLHGYAGLFDLGECDLRASCEARR